MLGERIARHPTISYPPKGYCIYCGRRDGILTDEHILPFGLGGCYLLPKSSCEDCQKLIHPVETICMRKMLRAYRVRIGLAGRHTDSTPASFSLDVINRDRPPEEIFLPPLRHPSSIILVKLAPPGL